MKNDINNLFAQTVNMLGKSENIFAHDCLNIVLRKEVRFRLLTELEYQVTKKIYMKRLELKNSGIGLKNTEGISDLVKSLDSYNDEKLLLIELRDDKYSFYIFCTMDLNKIISILRNEIDPERGQIEDISNSNSYPADPKFHKFKKLKYTGEM